MSVDLPAPFGPSSPNTEPRGMVRSMPFNASFSLRLAPPRYNLVSPLIATAASGAAAEAGHGAADDVTTDMGRSASRRDGFSKPGSAVH